MINRNHLDKMLETEELLFEKLHPKSKIASVSNIKSLVGGVPMPWMTRLPGSFPIHVRQAHGAMFTDIDDIDYIDFCLGDTGSMTGHGVKEITEAISAQMNNGATTMLPTQDAHWVGEELTRRFGLSKWQFAVSATDANRFVLRIARHLTKRPKILVHDWCYHGTVDETLVIADEHGQTVSRPGAIGPQIDPALTTRVVPYNDLEALELQLAHRDVACMLIEPALTNIGIVLPAPGYLEGVRQLTQKYGTLLIVDETHTICAGAGGCTELWSLKPDILVIGKSIGGGFPVAAYGLSEELAAQLSSKITEHDVDVSGIGGTLAGSALAMAAIKVTLTNCLLPEQFEKTCSLATRWASGVKKSFTEHNLDWSVQQLGCRAEYWFCAPPVNGAQAAAASDPQLENFMHLWAMNRGVLLTPFHNMALMSPFHKIEDVDKHTQVFNDALDTLTSQ